MDTLDDDLSKDAVSDGEHSRFLFLSLCEMMSMYCFGIIAHPSIFPSTFLPLQFPCLSDSIYR